MTATQHDDFLDQVREHEEAALTALGQATGNSSLCALSRRGTPHPAAKFQEGAVAALADVRRSLTRDPERTPCDALAAARTRWEQRNGALATRGRDWAAYYAGGNEALDLLDAGSTGG